VEETMVVEGTAVVTVEMMAVEVTAVTMRVRANLLI
jgi:hypothetical protein